LDGIPIVISGMASSSIGMTPLPYGQVPFDMHGSGIETSYRQEEPGFRHDILLISGVKSNNDVMRGEETQLIGIYKEGMNTGLQTFIFPGTHSKHIAIEDNRAVDFRTYMTGEFFELLSKKSILHSSVEKNDDLQDTGSLKSFKQGVKDAMQSNLLHNCFKVRTNHLFGTFGRKENYHYLSGLLIGAEMQELQNIDAGTIYLCCGSGLKNYYEAAIAELGLDHRTHIFPARSVDESVIKGQGKILFKQAKNE
ncbi:MAG: 2-dehydro-3-deoxygalactonokinase, partial [Chitinophagaceae bacterium]